MSAQTKNVSKKGKKYTVLLTVCLCIAFGIGLLVLVTFYASNINEIDASGAVELKQYIEEKKFYLFLWRIILYTLLIFVFYKFNKRKLKNGDKKKEYIRHSTTRLASYIILFELIIVQNIFGKLYSIATG